MTELQLLVLIQRLYARVAALERKVFPGRRARIAWAVGYPYDAKGTKMPLEITLHTGKAIDVRATPITDDGHVVTLDGAATWSLVSGTGAIGTSLQGGAPLPPDGLQQSLLAGDTVGDSLFQISGDAAPGEPVHTILDSVIVHVEPREAATFGLAAGTEYDAGT